MAKTIRYAVRLLFAAVCVVALLAAALYVILLRRGSPLNPDLHDRSGYELDVVIRWRQSDLIPNCRQNYAETMPGRVCDGTIMQYFQGPSKVPRDEKAYRTNISFLPNIFANMLAFATSTSKYNTLTARCGEDEIKALSNWTKANSEVLRQDLLTVTYLSPDDPWSFCLHRDNHSWDYDIRHGKKPTLEHHQFWIWRGGQVIGEADCSSIERRTTTSKIYPHCRINLWFDRGNYQMTIGGSIPAASLRVVLDRLKPITQNFWKQFEVEVEGYDFNRALFYPPVELNERAQHLLAQIERDVR